MFRFQTLPAFCAFLILAACSQTSPPHSPVAAPDKTGNKQLVTTNPGGASPSPSMAPLATADVSDVIPTTDLTTPGVAKVVMSGTSGKWIYQLMSVVMNPQPSTQKTTRYLKEGNGFSCEQTLADYTCTFLFSLTDGSIQIQKDLSRVTVGIPEASLPEKSPSLSLFFLDPKKENLALNTTIKVSTIQNAAKDIYDHLAVKEVPLQKDKMYDDGGAEKRGTHIDCLMEKPHSAPGATWYSCYFYINVVNGSVDLVSDGITLFSK